MALINKQAGCSDPDCGCAPGCCICVHCANVDCYRIKDYSDTYFTVCASCFSSAGTAWDGTMAHQGACFWNKSFADDSSLRIGGTLFQGATLRFFPLTTCWELEVACLTFDSVAKIWRGARTGFSPAGLFTQLDGCSPGPATLEIEACPGAVPITVPTCYRIAGYSDGDLVACGSCSNRVDPVWDGTFPAHSGSCSWEPAAVSGPSISGKLLDNTGVGVASGLYFNTLTCSWRMDVRCRAGGTRFDIWVGTKSTGSTPAGVYIRIAGCDTTTTLTIEECP